MRNISFKQLIALVLIFFLLFGDFFSFKKKLSVHFKQLNKYVFRKNRKKRT